MIGLPQFCCIAFAGFLVGIGGCLGNGDSNGNGSSTDAPVAETGKAHVVIAGVENGYAGKCSGALADVKNMKDLLCPYASKMVVMTDSEATKGAVAAALKEGVKDDFLIFYYSGHGGFVGGSNDKTEADGCDEYLCCWDRGLLDNEIWAIVSKSKGRVLLIFDCCHSGTMFRVPMKVSPAAGAALRAVNHAEGGVNMICWSGAPDDSYSYGSSSGGYMTNALRRHFDKSLTYDELWNRMEGDSKLADRQAIQSTKMGEDFGGRRVFQ